MAKKKLIKVGDRTLTISNYGDPTEVRNRILNDEAAFAMDLIMADRSDRVPGAVVERAFAISKAAYAHVKANRMDTPFPFAKVYPDENA